MLVAYLLSLGLTLGLEVPVYSAGLVYLGRVRLRSAVAAGILVNLLTHPLGFLVVLPLLGDRLGYWPTLGVIEVGAWIIEGMVLVIWLKRNWVALLGLSFVANGLSLGVGLLLWH